MSDKHKFRAWDESQKYMAYQGSPDLETIQSFMYHFGDEELMESTFLHDKGGDGKEVWEGDIFDVVFKNCPDGFNIIGRETEVKIVRGIVVKKFGAFRVKFIHHELNEVVYVLLYEFLKNEEKVVIGNIYENPELINQPIKQDGNDNE